MINLGSSLKNVRVKLGYSEALIYETLYEKMAPFGWDFDPEDICSWENGRKQIPSHLRNIVDGLVQSLKKELHEREQKADDTTYELFQMTSAPVTRVPGLDELVKKRMSSEVWQQPRNSSGHKEGVGRLLYEARLRLCLIQRDIATLCGTDKGTVQNWERSGKIHLDYQPIIQAIIAKAFSIETPFKTPPDLHPDIQEFIAARRANNFSQGDMTVHTGIPVNTIRGFENGEPASKSLLRKIRKFNRTMKG